LFLFFYRLGNYGTANYKAPYGRIGCDAPPALVDSVVNNAASIAKDASFVILPGKITELIVCVCYLKIHLYRIFQGIYSIIILFNLLFSLSLSHSFTYSFRHSLFLSLSLSHPSIHSFIHLYIHPSIYSFLYFVVLVSVVFLYHSSF